MADFQTNYLVAVTVAQLTELETLRKELQGLLTDLKEPVTMDVKLTLDSGALEQQVRQTVQREERRKGPSSDYTGPERRGVAPAVASPTVEREHDALDRASRKLESTIDKLNAFLERSTAGRPQPVVATPPVPAVAAAAAAVEEVAVPSGPARPHFASRQARARSVVNALRTKKAELQEEMEAFVEATREIEESIGLDAEVPDALMNKLLRRAQVDASAKDGPDAVLNAMVKREEELQRNTERYARRLLRAEETLQELEGRKFPAVGGGGSTTARTATLSRPAGTGGGGATYSFDARELEAQLKLLKDVITANIVNPLMELSHVNLGGLLQQAKEAGKGAVPGAPVVTAEDTKDAERAVQGATQAAQAQIKAWGTYRRYGESQALLAKKLTEEHGLPEIAIDARRHDPQNDPNKPYRRKKKVRSEYQTYAEQVAEELQDRAAARERAQKTIEAAGQRLTDEDFETTARLAPRRLVYVPGRIGVRGDHETVQRAIRDDAIRANALYNVRAGVAEIRDNLSASQGGTSGQIRPGSGLDAGRGPGEIPTQDEFLARLVQQMRASVRRLGLLPISEVADMGPTGPRRRSPGQRGPETSFPEATALTDTPAGHLERRASEWRMLAKDVETLEQGVQTATNPTERAKRQAALDTRLQLVNEPDTPLTRKLWDTLVAGGAVRPGTRDTPFQRYTVESLARGRTTPFQSSAQMVEEAQRLEAEARRAPTSAMGTVFGGEIPPVYTRRSQPKYVSDLLVEQQIDPFAAHFPTLHPAYQAATAKQTGVFRERDRSWINDFLMGPDVLYDPDLVKDFLPMVKHGGAYRPLQRPIPYTLRTTNLEGRRLQELSDVELADLAANLAGQRKDAHPESEHFASLSNDFADVREERNRRRGGLRPRPVGLRPELSVVTPTALAQGDKAAVDMVARAVEAMEREIAATIQQLPEEQRGARETDLRHIGQRQLEALFGLERGRFPLLTGGRAEMTDAEYEAELAGYGPGRAGVGRRKRERVDQAQQRAIQALQEETDPRFRRDRLEFQRETLQREIAQFDEAIKGRPDLYKESVKASGLAPSDSELELVTKMLAEGKSHEEIVAAAAARFPKRRRKGGPEGGDPLFGEQGQSKDLEAELDRWEAGLVVTGGQNALTGNERGLPTGPAFTSPAQVAAFAASLEARRKQLETDRAEKAKQLAQVEEQLKPENLTPLEGFAFTRGRAFTHVRGAEQGIDLINELLGDRPAEGPRGREGQLVQRGSEYLESLQTDNTTRQTRSRAKVLDFIRRDLQEPDAMFEYLRKQYSSYQAKIADRARLTSRLSTGQIEGEDRGKAQELITKLGDEINSIEEHMVQAAINRVKKSLKEPRTKETATTELQQLFERNPFLFEHFGGGAAEIQLAGRQGRRPRVTLPADLEGTRRGLEQFAGHVRPQLEYVDALRPEGALAEGLPEVEDIQKLLRFTRQLNRVIRGTRNEKGKFTGGDPKATYDFDEDVFGAKDIAGRAGILSELGGRVPVQLLLDTLQQKMVHGRLSQRTAFSDQGRRGEQEYDDLGIRVPLLNDIGTPEGLEYRKRYFKALIADAKEVGVSTKEYEEELAQLETLQAPALRRAKRRQAKAAAEAKETAGAAREGETTAQKAQRFSEQFAGVGGLSGQEQSAFLGELLGLRPGVASKLSPDAHAFYQAGQRGILANAETRGQAARAFTNLLRTEYLRNGLDSARQLATTLPGESPTYKFEGLAQNLLREFGRQGQGLPARKVRQGTGVKASELVEDLLRQQVPLNEILQRVQAAVPKTRFTSLDALRKFAENREIELPEDGAAAAGQTAARRGRGRRGGKKTVAEAAGPVGTLEERLAALEDRLKSLGGTPIDPLVDGFAKMAESAKVIDSLFGKYGKVIAAMGTRQVEGLIRKSISDNQKQGTGGGKRALTAEEKRAKDREDAEKAAQSDERAEFSNRQFDVGVETAKAAAQVLSEQERMHQLLDELRGIREARVASRAAGIGTFSLLSDRPVGYRRSDVPADLVDRLAQGPIAARGIPQAVIALLPPTTSGPGGALAGPPIYGPASPFTPDLSSERTARGRFRRRSEAGLGPAIPLGPVPSVSERELRYLSAPSIAGLLGPGRFGPLQGPPIPLGPVAPSRVVDERGNGESPTLPLTVAARHQLRFDAEERRRLASGQPLITPAPRRPELVELDQLVADLEADLSRWRRALREGSLATDDWAGFMRRSAQRLADFVGLDLRGSQQGVLGAGVRAVAALPPGRFGPLQGPGIPVSGQIWQHLLAAAQMPAIAGLLPAGRFGPLQGPAIPLAGEVAFGPHVRYSEGYYQSPFDRYRGPGEPPPGPPLPPDMDHLRRLTPGARPLLMLAAGNALEYDQNGLPRTPVLGQTSGREAQVLDDLAALGGINRSRFGNVFEAGGGNVPPPPPPPRRPGGGGGGDDGGDEERRRKREQSAAERSTRFRDLAARFGRSVGDGAGLLGRLFQTPSPQQGLLAYLDDIIRRMKRIQGLESDITRGMQEVEERERQGLKADDIYAANAKRIPRHAAEQEELVRQLEQARSRSQTAAAFASLDPHFREYYRAKRDRDALEQAKKDLEGTDPTKFAAAHAEFNRRGIRSQDDLTKAEEETNRAYQAARDNLTRNGSALARYQREVQKTTGFLGQMGIVFRRVAFYLTAGGLAYGLAAEIRRAFTESVRLEASVTRIQGILGRAGLGRANDIREASFDISRRYGVPVTTSAETIQTFAQAGFRGPELAEAARAATAGVVGAALDPNTAKELLISIKNVSEGQIKFGDIVDRISRIESTRAVTAQDLALSLERSGSIAKQLQPDRLGNVDFADLVIGATTSIIEKTRVSGTQAATGLRFILGRLANPEIAGKLQSKFGINLAANPEGTQLRPLQDILQDVAGRYQELRSSGKSEVANSLLATVAGTRQINLAAALFSDFDNTLQIATESSRAFGDTNRRAALQMNTLEKRMELTRVAFTEFVDALLEKTGLIKGLKGIFDGLTGAFKFAAKSPGLAIGATAGVALLGRGLLTGVGGVLGRGAVAAGANLLGGGGAIAGTLGTLSRFAIFLGTKLTPVLALATALGALLAVTERLTEASRKRAEQQEKFGFDKFDETTFRDTDFYKDYKKQAQQFGLSPAELFDAVARANLQTQKDVRALFPKQKGLFALDPKLRETNPQVYEATRQALAKNLKELVPGFDKLGDAGTQLQIAADLLRQSAQYGSARSSTLAAGLSDRLGEFENELQSRAARLSGSRVLRERPITRPGIEGADAAAARSARSTESAATRRLLGLPEDDGTGAPPSHIVTAQEQALQRQAFQDAVDALKKSPSDAGRDTFLRQQIGFGYTRDLARAAYGGTGTTKELGDLSTIFDEATYGLGDRIKNTQFSTGRLFDQIVRLVDTKGLTLGQAFDSVIDSAFNLSDAQEKLVEAVRAQVTGSSKRRLSEDELNAQVIEELKRRGQRKGGTEAAATAAQLQNRANFERTVDLAVGERFDLTNLLKEASGELPSEEAAGGGRGEAELLRAIIKSARRRVQQTQDANPEAAKQIIATLDTAQDNLSRPSYAAKLGDKIRGQRLIRDRILQTLLEAAEQRATIDVSTDLFKQGGISYDVRQERANQSTSLLRNLGALGPRLEREAIYNRSQLGQIVGETLSADILDENDQGKLVFSQQEISKGVLKAVGSAAEQVPEEQALRLRSQGRQYREALRLFQSNENLLHLNDDEKQFVAGGLGASDFELAFANRQKIFELAERLSRADQEDLLLAQKQLAVSQSQLEVEQARATVRDQIAEAERGYRTRLAETQGPRAAVAERFRQEQEQAREIVRKIDEEADRKIRSLRAEAAAKGINDVQLNAEIQDVEVKRQAERQKAGADFERTQFENRQGQLYQLQIQQADSLRQAIEQGTAGFRTLFDYNTIIPDKDQRDQGFDVVDSLLQNLLGPAAGQVQSGFGQQFQNLLFGEGGPLRGVAQSLFGIPERLKFAEIEADLIYNAHVSGIEDGFSATDSGASGAVGTPSVGKTGRPILDVLREINPSFTGAAGTAAAAVVEDVVKPTGATGRTRRRPGLSLDELARLGSHTAPAVLPAPVAVPTTPADTTAKTASPLDKIYEDYRKNVLSKIRFDSTAAVTQADLKKAGIAFPGLQSPLLGTAPGLPTDTSAGSSRLQQILQSASIQQLFGITGRPAEIRMESDGTSVDGAGRRFSIGGRYIAGADRVTLTPAQLQGSDEQVERTLSHELGHRLSYQRPELAASFRRYLGGIGVDPKAGYGVNFQEYFARGFETARNELQQPLGTLETPAQHLDRLRNPRVYGPDKQGAPFFIDYLLQQPQFKKSPYAPYAAPFNYDLRPFGQAPGDRNLPVQDEADFLQTVNGTARGGDLSPVRREPSRVRALLTASAIPGAKNGLEVLQLQGMARAVELGMTKWSKKPELAARGTYSNFAELAAAQRGNPFDQAAVDASVLATQDYVNKRFDADAKGRPVDRARLPEVPSRGQQLLLAGSQLAGTLAGTALGNSLGKGRGSLANIGSSLGSAIGGTLTKASFGGAFKFLGSAAGPVGAVVGGLLGGLLGGLFGKKPEAPPRELQALEVIGRNTGETVQAIRSEGKLANLENRLLNVPVSFSVPQYRPVGFGGGENAGAGSGAVTNVSDNRVYNLNITSNNPHEVRAEVEKLLSEEVRGSSRTHNRYR